MRHGRRGTPEARLRVRHGRRGGARAEEACRRVDWQRRRICHAAWSMHHADDRTRSRRLLSAHSAPQHTMASRSSLQLAARPRPPHPQLVAEPRASATAPARAESRPCRLCALGHSDSTARLTRLACAWAVRLPRLACECADRRPRRGRVGTESSRREWNNHPCPFTAGRGSGAPRGVVPSAVRCTNKDKIE